jgi:hypothetical protein
VLKLPACIAALSLAASALAAEAPPVATVFTPLAHSSLVTVEGAAAARTLLLRVRRAGDRQALAGAELGVTLNGANIPAALLPDGSWAVPLPQPPPKTPGKLQIVVAHDGVREVLDAQLPAAGGTAAGAAAAPAPAGATGALSALAHKQMSWWVLNIIIAVIGVVAISRRMS